MNDQQRLADEAYLAAIVESSDDAILSKNTEGIIRSCNPAVERIFGYKPEELIGQSIRTLIPPDRQAEEDEILRRIRSGQRVDHFETVRLRKDGRAIDVSLTISPVRGSFGEVIGASKIARDITEQKKNRMAQAYLAAIVDSSTDAIISKDLDGIVRSCNRSCERIFGYSAAELVGRPIRVLVPPERQAEEDDILVKLRRGERINDFETVRIAKDGRKVDISLSVSPIRDAAGEIIGVAKVARDISERKLIERELEAQREWLRVTLASIGDAVITSDVNGCLTYMNASAESLTGWSSAEAAGRHLDDVFHVINERTGQRVQNPAELVMRSGSIVGLANHSVLTDRHGAQHPIADSAAPIRSADGRIIGVVLVFRDITEQRRAMDAIAEQREWLETTLESIGDAVIATDVQGKVVFMNPIAEHLTGWPLDRARDRPCTEVFDIVNEETRRTVQSPVMRVLAEGIVVGLANHTTLISADGTERPIDDSGAPIRNKDGRLIGTVLVFRDITERRRSEADRRNAAIERERLLAAERTARADAERANRVKDEFIAMVSHELRTPLNAILGWAQLMMHSRTDADVITRGVDVITRNTRLQAQLISDLHDMSRILSGKLRLSIEKVDLPDLIENSIEAVQQAAKNKRVTLQHEISGTPPIAGDSARLQQVVWNLLWNAIKFTPEGGSVLVRLRSVGSDAEITVKDTGIGIRPEFLPHVFERFQQGNVAITRRFGGLGLGLAIAKHLVDLHGGTIRAESAGEGQGATFTVVLPSSVLPETDGAAATSEHARYAAMTADLPEGMRILLVEDESDTLDFLKRFLESYGADVVTAGSAVDALAVVTNSRFDLLISDIGLPDMDGYELLQRIRRLDVGTAAGMPAIALTAYVRAEDRKAAFRAGYQAHLAKPLEPNELLETIATLAKSSAPDGGPAG
jgi:PAS domain S-box-containing protein